MIGEAEWNEFRWKIQAVLDESVSGIYPMTSLPAVGEWILLAYVADGENQKGDVMMMATPDNQPAHRTIGLIRWADDPVSLFIDDEEDG